MADSTFDPTQLVDTEFNEVLDTKIIPVPKGDWKGQIEKIEGGSIKSNKDGTVYPVLNVTWLILDDEVSKTTKREQNRVRQTVFLEMNDSGGLDMGPGKNVQLGRLRAAVGQNKAGKKWKPSDMQGQLALVTVDHEQNPNGDASDPNDVFVNVTKVAPLT